jgi:hypothetical protein
VVIGEETMKSRYLYWWGLPFILGGPFLMRKLMELGVSAWIVVPVFVWLWVVITHATQESSDSDYE